LLSHRKTQGILTRRRADGPQAECIKPEDDELGRFRVIFSDQDAG
jgi:hypothetical protein